MKRNLKKFNTVIWREGKYYVAQCLNVDISSFGKTKREAIKNIDEALVLYFKDTPASSLRKVESPELVALSFSHA